jgi:DNA/RNA-binding domain of Phe-tRNA-synthetase-like protein
MSAQCRLPDGRLVRIDQEARDRLSCGVIVIDPVVVDQSLTAAHESAALAPDLQEKYAGTLPSEIPGLAEARTLYKSFGMDPSRHRPSSEALLRRTLQGKDLYRISNVVDSCNLASLTVLLPIGMYDLRLVQGDITLRTGSEGEEYPGIRKGPVHLAGRLGLFDQTGPFGSPTSDSARTCVTDSTTAILAVIMATAGYDPEQMERNLQIFSDVFVRHCNGVETLRAVLGPGEDR